MVEVDRTPARLCKAIQTGDLVVGCMDVCSLYPSCKRKETAGHVRELLKESSLEFCGVDRRALVRYLGLVRGKKSTPEDRFIPVAKGTTTLRSYLKRDTKNQFYPGEESHSLLSDRELKVLLGLAITERLEVVSKNHFYSVGGQVMR